MTTATAGPTTGRTVTTVNLQPVDDALAQADQLLNGVDSAVHDADAATATTEPDPSR
jgi:hypothetical protein